MKDRKMWDKVGRLVEEYSHDSASIRGTIAGLKLRIDDCDRAILERAQSELATLELVGLLVKRVNDLAAQDKKAKIPTVRKKVAKSKKGGEV